MENQTMSIMSDLKSDDVADIEVGLPTFTTTSSNVSYSGIDSLSLSATTWLATVFYSSVILLSLGGNTLVIYTIVRICGLSASINHYIINLACADILMAVLCIPLTFISELIFGYWPFGSHSCRLVTYAQAVAVFCNAFTLVCISRDRRRVVCRPLDHNVKPRARLIGVWVASLALPLPVTVSGLVSDWRGGWQGMCVEVLPWGNDRRYKFIYTVVVMICQYFLPLCILSVTYVSLAYNIWLKKAPGEPELRRDQRMADAKKKMIKMMIAVVVVYAVCWLPLHTVLLSGDLYEDFWNFPHARIVWISCHWLAMSSCCYNPIVYWWMGSNFRAGFRTALSRCCLLASNE